MAMLGAYDVELLPTPISRSETLMKKIATGDNNLDDVDNLQSRYEFLLAYIIKAGGFNGGNGDFYYNLTSLTSGFTTIYDTLDKPVKNAFLRGQTLVNVNRSNFITNENITTDYTNAIVFFDVDMKANTTYTLIAYSDNQYEFRLSQLVNNTTEVALGDLHEVGVPFVFTTNTSFTGLRGYLKGDSLNIPQGTEIKILIIEGDHSNEDIPYFEGMASVKMPVLTTTGKNLFDFANSGLREESAYDKSLHPQGFWLFGVQLQPNKKVTISRKNNDGYNLGLSLKINNENTSAGGNWMIANHAQSENKSSVTLTTNSDGYIWFLFSNNFNKINQILDICEYIQIEYGTVATSYEPFKSNILTCNEEVTLRGIGDIKDELNLTTGELTQRIGEFVFDGSSDELWFITTNDSGFKRFVSDVKKTHSKYSEITNWLPTANKSYWMLNENGFYIGTNSSPVIVFNTNDSRYNMSITEFENYLSQNPLIVQYPLAEETIKTVTLSTLDQDGKETELNTFDDITHVIVSSEGLVPTGEIDIARPVQFMDYSLDNGETPLYNTIEYPVKSAILKGNTEKVFSPLKNLFDGFLEIGSIDNDNGVLISNTIYYRSVNFIVVEPSTNYIISTNGAVNGRLFYYDGNFNFIGNSVSSDKALSPSNAKYMKFRVDADKKDNKIQVEKNNVITDYEEPNYILQSVKMPVLTTTGKNLFNDEVELGTVNSDTGELFDYSLRARTVNFLNIKPNTSYSFKSFNGYLFNRVFFYDSQKNYISNVVFDVDYKVVTSPENARYIKIVFKKQIDSTMHNDLVIIPNSIQIEEGSTAISYEPHKSNILTCNEEVELRGIGNIKDELNLLTGEYTKAIYEYTFTGNEYWEIGGSTGGYTYFKCGMKHLPINYNYESDINIPIFCNNLPTVTYRDFDNKLKSVGINLTYFFRLNFSDCDSNNGATVEDLKTYLKANPTTVQYPISKSVKTVTLSTRDQDGKKTELNTFNDITYVTVSSEGLIPTGEITVATKNAADVIDASVMSLRMDDILNSQRTLEGPANAQSDDIDVAMLGTTDIYEQLL